MKSLKWNSLSQLQKYALEEYGHDATSWDSLNPTRQSEFLSDATAKQNEDFEWELKEFKQENN